MRIDLLRALPVLCIALLALLGSPSDVKSEAATERSVLTVEAGPRADGLLKSDLSRSVPRESSSERWSGRRPEGSLTPGALFSSYNQPRVRPHSHVRRALLHVYRL